MSDAILDRLFDQLWSDFTRINPQAGVIHRLLESLGETVVNDHVAFRTFSDSRVNIDVLARPFLEQGYCPVGEYHFEQKKLDARHFEHPEPQYPKVFISELRLHEMSTSLQAGVSELIDQIPSEVLSSPQFCAVGRPWSVSHKTYELLAGESEYAGWMSAFGFRANHFTVLVNSLQTLTSLGQLNELIKQAGYALNSEGGEIKGSPDVFLEQSSTLASQAEVEFSDGTFTIPGCYYEFARRYPVPGGGLFSGFVTQSADKIFQSTDRQKSL